MLQSAPWPLRRRGFTLVELVIALSLMALLAGLAYPSAVRAINRKRVEGTANEMLTMMRRARALPMSNDSYNQVAVAFSKAKDTSVMGDFACYAVVNYSDGTIGLCDCGNYPGNVCGTAYLTMLTAEVFSTVVLPTKDGVTMTVVSKDGTGANDKKQRIIYNHEGMTLNGSTMTVTVASAAHPEDQLNVRVSSSGLATICSTGNFSGYPAC